jgi:hypothetical protein
LLWCGSFLAIEVPVRAIALLVALSLFSFPTLSEGALKAECPERIAHLGGLLQGIAQDQHEEALGLVALLQKNGLFYSALVEALKSNGITPHKPQAWKWFVSDFYLLPERQAVVDETASRLILEFFGSPTDTLDQVIAQGDRTALGAGVFIQARKILRKIEPISGWSGIVEHAIFRDNNAIVAELNARMRRYFPRANRPLLPFPPSLSEVRNAYAALPIELVVFDAQRRLTSTDPAEADQVATDLKKAGHGESPMVQRALLWAYQLRELNDQVRARGARTLAAHRAQVLSQTLAELDRAKQERETAAIAESITGLQERISRLEQKHAKIVRRLQAEKDSSIERAKLAQRAVEKTSSAVVAMRAADRAGRRFLRARRDWLSSQRPASSRSGSSASTETPSLATQLSRDIIQDALYADDLDGAGLEAILLDRKNTITRLTPEQFTQSAVYMLELFVTDDDIEVTDPHLVVLAETVLNAARKLNFKLSIAQVERIRDGMKTAGAFLVDPDAVDDEETNQFRRAQNNLAWLSISDTTLVPKSAPTPFEERLRAAGFAFEVARMDAGEADQIDLALISLVTARGLSSEQLTYMLERLLDGVSTQYESTQTTVLVKVCNALWSFQPGLSEAQIGRLRASIHRFTEDMPDEDEKQKIRALYTKTSSWLALASRYSPEADAGVSPPVQPSPVATTPTPSPETLPEEIEELGSQAERLFSEVRRLQLNSDSTRAYETEKRVRADLRTVLSKMDEGGFTHNLDAVEEILTAAYQSLSTDRFTAVFNEVALLYAFKQEVSSDQEEETAYCKMLVKFLKTTHLSSRQAASIGATFIRILGLTDERGNSLVGDNTEDTVVPEVCEWIFGLPQGIEVADADVLCKALRDLAALYKSPEWNNHPSAVWLLRWAADTRWLSRTERTPTSTEERLRAIERELAENEVELQQARATVQAAAGGR